MFKRNHIVIYFLVAVPIILLLCIMTGSTGFGIPDTGTETGRSILYLRLYRVFTGFVVGAALSCAGAVLQALLRNPLAEPYVIGVSSGAGLGATLAIASGLSAISSATLPFSAFVFAIATLVIVYGLANTAGRISIYGLVLSGVIVSSICSSLLMSIVALSQSHEIQSIMWWLLGNLEVSSRPLFIVSSVLILVGSCGIWLMAPELNALSLGREMAHHVGVRTKLSIAIGLILATLITAAAVSISGLIGFVGLVVPHTVRTITGPDHRRLIPVTAITGGLFLALCDAVARIALAPRELPVGVVTALIGGPFFITILRGRRKQGWIE
ncbi:MAG: iron ABC transporter permease [Kiritimatiellae bacterium]|nr:iron ABC transporter permease [Kiritimatiellia bacterium]MDD5522863.1 iron ABC transporter permease [Kiritimatiellia bacterium]